MLQTLINYLITKSQIKTSKIFKDEIYSRPRDVIFLHTCKLILLIFLNSNNFFSNIVFLTFEKKLLQNFNFLERSDAINYLLIIILKIIYINKLKNIIFLYKTICYIIRNG